MTHEKKQPEDRKIVEQQEMKDHNEYYKQNGCHLRTGASSR